MRRLASVSPESTVFIFLAFEGPDRYSLAGGLGTRMAGLTEALARAGYETHFYFIGDPNAPGEGRHPDIPLVLHRWCQWISRYYPVGVYQGEEFKVRDFTHMVCHHIADSIMPGILAAGKQAIIQAEEWQTADALCATSDLLHARGMRDRAFFVWNANNDMGFERVNWGRLSYVALLTTVSHYMKHRMWQQGVDPAAIPNGIPESLLTGPDAGIVFDLRRRMNCDALLLKVGRFDPDKRWDMAIDAVAAMRDRGTRTTLLARGGAEGYGGQVLARAGSRGLRISPVVVDSSDGFRPEDYVSFIGAASGADVVDLRFFMSPDVLGIANQAADAVLANSGHEPFGLVGLEAMAAGGVAFTGATGEEYARHLENAVVLQSADAGEIAYYVRWLKQHPEVERQIRENGRATAARYVWAEIIKRYTAALECALGDPGQGSG
jgi:glycosyltransferase involved in cell wall biosynthesis